MIRIALLSAALLLQDLAILALPTAAKTVTQAEIAARAAEVGNLAAAADHHAQSVTP